MDMAVFVIIAVLALAVYSGLFNRKQEEGEECTCECSCGYEEFAVKPNGRKCISQNVMRNRDGKKQKVGVLISCQKKGKVHVGYSLCCKTDEYDEKEAYVRASKRMGETTLNPPQSLKKDLDKFLGRCARYYKGATVPSFDGKTINQ